MLFDLHMHSEYSFDCRSRVDDILRTAKARGLAGIAITDHERFDGAVEAGEKAAQYGVMVIPGMEVATEEGDVIGLFLTEPIEGRRFAEVVAEIRAQGGVVYYPHPFKRRERIPAHVIESIDVLEVWNARGEALGPRQCNAMAAALAQQENLPVGAGSDAHFLWEIGRGAVDLGDVSSLGEARARLLERGDKRIVRRPTPYLAEVASQFVKARKTGRRDVWRSATRRLLRWIKWHTVGRVYRAFVAPILWRDNTRVVRRSVNRFLTRCAEELPLEGPVLDIGSARGSYSHQLFGERFPYETLDLDESTAPDHVADLCAMPEIPSQRYGTVVCTEVLEHTRNPFAAAAELYRITRPGGHCLVTTPFNLRIHGPPPDCWRFTEEGLRTLFANGFDIVRLDAVHPRIRRNMPIHYRVVLRRPATSSDEG